MSEEIIRETSTKAKLSKFADLDSGKIEQLSGEQLEEYTEELDKSVSIFHAQKEKIESAFYRKDYEGALRWLLALRNSLVRIYADGLAKECERYLNQNKDIDNIRPEKLGCFIDYFLATTALFFTDLQNLLNELEIVPKDRSKELGREDFREKLLKVPELSGRKIRAMSDRSLERYFATLNDFVEGHDIYESTLRANLEAKNYPAALESLTVVANTLSKIHADDLFEECRDQIRLYEDVDSIRGDKFEIFVNYFLSNIEMLLEDIKAVGLPNPDNEDDVE
jgi:hypothetical protein